MDSVLRQDRIDWVVAWLFAVPYAILVVLAANAIVALRMRYLSSTPKSTVMFGGNHDEPS